LDDKAQIQHLQREYAARFDARDPEGFAGLFTPDAEVILPNGYRLTGHEKMLKVVRNTPAGGVHLPEDGRIDVDGDSATASSRFRFEPGTGDVVTGEYEDRFVRTPDGWRFAFRRSVPDGAAG
jgi:uncharacterized protein (TIGR02246 family)